MACAEGIFKPPLRTFLGTKIIDYRHPSWINVGGMKGSRDRRRRQSGRGGGIKREEGTWMSEPTIAKSWSANANLISIFAFNGYDKLTADWLELYELYYACYVLMERHWTDSVLVGTLSCFSIKLYGAKWPFRAWWFWCTWPHLYSTLILGCSRRTRSPMLGSSWAGRPTLS